MKLEEILLCRSQASCSLVCVLLSRSITASVACPLFLSPCPTYPLNGGAHTHRQAKEKLKVHTYTGILSLRRQLMGCSCCRLWLRSCAGITALNLSCVGTHTTLVFFISHVAAISSAAHVKGIVGSKRQ